MHVSTTHKDRRLITIVIFVVLFLIRLIYITNSTAETGDFWRQSDTESIARNFIKYRFNIFYPQFNYDGPPPNYVQLEFQLTTFIIAILYKAFAHHIWLARLVPISFFMLSVYFLYLIGKRFFKLEQALTSIVIYGMLPITVFYSRAIMPESALLCFFTGAYYFFIRWYDTEKLSYLFISSLFTCLAISQKIPAAFIGLAMVALCIYKYGLKMFLRWELWSFAIISLAPNLFYFLWLGNIAESKYVSGIATVSVMPKFLTAIFTPQALSFYKFQLPSCFTWPILAISALGLLSTFNKQQYPILFWALAVILEVVFIVSVIHLRYYLILLAPIAALLSGKILGLLWNRILLTRILLFVLFVLIANKSVEAVSNEFEEVAWVKNAVEVIDTNTEPRDLILIGTEVPAILSMSDRAGWRGNVKYDIKIPKDIAGGMKYFISHGAKYFLVYDNNIANDDGGYISYLNQNYEKLDFGQGIVMYKLH